MTKNAIIRLLISFFQKLFSDSPDVSSKRVVGFMMAILFFIATIWHLVTKQVVQTDFIWAIISLCAACFGLNAYISSKQIEKDTPKGN